MKAKKEVTVAVIIGLILGLIIIGGVLRARSALMSLTPAATARPASQEKATVEQTRGLFLEIETPDNQVLKTSALTIAGKTLPGTYIVINGEAGDTIIVPSEVGNFSQEMTLVKGANTITVTVYQQDGTKQEKTITAVYTTAEI